MKFPDVINIHLIRLPILLRLDINQIKNHHGLAKPPTLALKAANL